MWLFYLLYFAWLTVWVIQSYLGYGTAYRLTKVNGDNGLSLFGWLIVCNLASLIPGLGIYLWNKYRYEDQQYDNTPYIPKTHITPITKSTDDESTKPNAATSLSAGQKRCSNCERPILESSMVCRHCGSSQD